MAPQNKHHHEHHPTTSVAKHRVPRWLRLEVVKTWGNSCYCCGIRPYQLKSKEGLQMHHLRPYSMGGKTILENLIPICGNCHNEVHKLIDMVNQPVRAGDSPRFWFMFVVVVARNIQREFMRTPFNEEAVYRDSGFSNQN